MGRHLAVDEDWMETQCNLGYNYRYYKLLLSTNSPRLILQPQSIINHIHERSNITNRWHILFLSPGLHSPRHLLRAFNSYSLLYLLSFFHQHPLFNPTISNGVIKDMLLDQFEEFTASQGRHNHSQKFSRLSVWFAPCTLYVLVRLSVQPRTEN